MFQYLLYKIGQGLIHCVPRSWAYALALFLSDWHFRFSTKDREAVIANLRHITGSDQNVEPRARQVFRNFGRYLVDFFFMYQVNDHFLRDQLRIEGREHLEAALAMHKGVIILTAHIGNWEMGAAVLAKMGHKLTAIALPHKQKLVNGLFNRQRIAHGVTVVPTSVSVRKCVEALRRGELIALLGDRDFGAFGELLPFLGRMTHIPKGAAFFSMKTKAPILPSFLVPDGKGGYVLSFFEPIYPSCAVAGEAFSAIQQIMRRYVSVIERKIIEDPAQWLMFRQFGVENEGLHTHSGV